MGRRARRRAGEEVLVTQLAHMGAVDWVLMVAAWAVLVGLASWAVAGLFPTVGGRRRWSLPRTGARSARAAEPAGEHAAPPRPAHDGGTAPVREAR